MQIDISSTKRKITFAHPNEQTLEIWEDRIKIALKRLRIRDTNQPCLTFTSTNDNNNEIDSTIQLTERNHVNDARAFSKENELAYRIQRLDNFIRNARRMKRKQPLSNIDPTWNKRLRLTNTMTNKAKRGIRQKTHRHIRRKMNDDSQLILDIPLITPQCLLFNKTNSVRS